MKKLTLTDLEFVGRRHVVADVVPGPYLVRGGLHFTEPGSRSHDAGCTCRACDGRGRHVHEDDHEVFIILQGRGRMEVDGESHPLVTGDVMICEPGEDHHLVSDTKDPCVIIYLHAGDRPHRAAQDKTG